MDLFDGVFVLDADLDTVNRRITERVALDPTDWGATPAERQLIARPIKRKKAYLVAASGIPSFPLTEG